jgi:hypothetical protein
VDREDGDDQLGRVAEARVQEAADARAVCSATCSVASPISHASGMSADRRDHEHDDVARVDDVVEDEDDGRQPERRPERAFRERDRLSLVGGGLAGVGRPSQLDDLRARLERLLDPVEALVEALATGQ